MTQGPTNAAGRGGDDAPSGTPDPRQQAQNLFGFPPRMGAGGPPPIPGQAPGKPKQPAPRPKTLDEAAIARGLEGRISAYPGTVTFHDLIERNRWESTALIILMVLLAALIGAAIAASFGIYAGGGYRSMYDQSLVYPSIEPAGQGLDLTRSAVLGGVAGLAAALIATLWSWFGGAKAILSMSGAQQIRPGDDPELFNVVDEVRIAAGLPMPQVFLIKETALNAFATGRDPAHAAVAITTGLRAQLSRDELQAVMAHEMAHVRHLDIRFAMLMATMVGLIVFACDAFFHISRAMMRSGAVRGSGRGKNSGGGAAIIVFIVALLLAIIAPIAARLIQMSYSRRREYLADAGAVELTRNPVALASALRKLADDREPLVEAANRGTAHLYIVNPLRKMREARQSINSMFSSHPPVEERIARLMALAR